MGARSGKYQAVSHEELCRHYGNPWLSYKTPNQELLGETVRINHIGVIFPFYRFYYQMPINRYSKLLDFKFICRFAAGP